MTKAHPNVLILHPTVGVGGGVSGAWGTVKAVRWRHSTPVLLKPVTDCTALSTDRIPLRTMFTDLCLCCAFVLLRQEIPQGQGFSVFISAASTYQPTTGTRRREGTYIPPLPRLGTPQPTLMVNNEEPLTSVPVAPALDRGTGSPPFPPILPHSVNDEPPPRLGVVYSQNAQNETGNSKIPPNPEIKPLPPSPLAHASEFGGWN